jgi:hypothetical protein
MQQQIEEYLGLKTQAGRTALAKALANVKLLDQKQQDYGSRNISSFGLFGVLVRMNDKFERLKNITLGKDGNGNVIMKPIETKNESVEDTFQDISNYAIIAAMLMHNEWPNE